MNIVINTGSTCLLISCSLILLACSDSSDPSTPGSAVDDQPPQGSQENFYVVGSGACRVGNGSDSIVGYLDENGELVPVDAENTGGEQPSDEDRLPCPGFAPAPLDNISGLSGLGDGVANVGGQSLLINGAAMMPGDTADAELDGSDATPGHSGVNLVLHDGETRSLLQQDSIGTVQLDWAVYNASVVLSVDLWAAGTEVLSGRTYQVVSDPGELDINEPALAGLDVAIEPIFVVDLDGDGTIGTGEFFEVTSGQFTWVGEPPDAMLSFELLLLDGRTLSGNYSGDIVSYELPPAAQAASTGMLGE